MTLVDTLLSSATSARRSWPASACWSGTAAFAVLCFSFAHDPRHQDARVAGGRRRARRSGAGVPFGRAAGGGRARPRHRRRRAAGGAGDAAPVGDARRRRGHRAVLLDPQSGGAAGARRRGLARDALRRGRCALADGGDDHRQRREHRAGDDVRLRARLGRGRRRDGDGDRAGRRVGRLVGDVGRRRGWLLPPAPRVRT